MDLLRTPFFEHHQTAGAKLIDFGGWEMPVQYAGIKAEHLCVRKDVGLFDVSHMGEVRFRGPNALEAVRYLVTNDVDVDDGEAQYSPMCKPDGGIVDDLIVYRLAGDDVLVCVNAANRRKDFDWMVQNNRFDGVTITNESDAWAQVAVQGRNAEATLQALTEIPLPGVPNFGVEEGSIAGVEGAIFARTGYTGEDGFEVFIPIQQSVDVWPAIIEAGAAHGIQPIGLGARDTLRLEMKMALYGNDITEETNPFEAALNWTVKLDKGDFIGRNALVAIKEAGGVKRRLVCLEVDGRIARPHCPILSDGTVVGEVTSGTRSPSLDKNIALGYVPRRLAKAGSQVQVDVRGRIADAVVVKPPFYKRPY